MILDAPANIEAMQLELLSGRILSSTQEKVDEAAAAKLQDSAKSLFSPARRTSIASAKVGQDMHQRVLFVSPATVVLEGDLGSCGHTEALKAALGGAGTVVCKALNTIPCGRGRIEDAKTSLSGMQATDTNDVKWAAGLAEFLQFGDSFGKVCGELEGMLVAGCEAQGPGTHHGTDCSVEGSLGPAHSCARYIHAGRVRWLR